MVPPARKPRPRGGFVVRSKYEAPKSPTRSGRPKEEIREKEEHRCGVYNTRKEQSKRERVSGIPVRIQEFP